VRDIILLIKHIICKDCLPSPNLTIDVCVRGIE